MAVRSILPDISSARHPTELLQAMKGINHDCLRMLAERPFDFEALKQLECQMGHPLKDLVTLEGEIVRIATSLLKQIPSATKSKVESRSDNVQISSSDLPLALQQALTQLTSTSFGMLFVLSTELNRPELLAHAISRITKKTSLTIDPLAQSDSLRKFFSEPPDSRPTIIGLPCSGWWELWQLLIRIGIKAPLSGDNLSALLLEHRLHRLCLKCTRPLNIAELRNAEETLSAIVTDDFLEQHLNSFKVSPGCAACAHTGNGGEIALYSLFECHSKNNDAINRGQTDWGQALALYQLCSPSGLEDGLQLLSLGSISPAEFATGFADFLRCRKNASISGVIQWSQPSVEHSSTALTVRTVVDAPHSPPIVGQQLPTPQATLRKKKVLIVDDDSDLRSVIRIVLESEFYEVIEAPDGHQALGLVFTNPPDLVLCDLAMPHLNGKEFVQRIRNEQALKSLPILMFTAYSDEDTEVDLLSTGANDFVSKTSSPKKIVARIRQLLSNKQ